MIANRFPDWANSPWSMYAPFWWERWRSNSAYPIVATIADVLGRFGYRGRTKSDKGMILRYLERTTGYSRRQLTRLVRRRLAGKKLANAYRARRAKGRCMGWSIPRG